MSRREFPAKVRVAAFERAAGKCEGCKAHLLAGQFHYDHDLPDGLGGEPVLSNCKVLCKSCHGVKTAKDDVPTIARVKRKHVSHIGAKPKPATHSPDRAPRNGSAAWMGPSSPVTKPERPPCFPRLPPRTLPSCPPASGSPTTSARSGSARFWRLRGARPLPAT